MSEQQNRRDDGISERVPDELIVGCPLKDEGRNIHTGHGEGRKSVVNIDTAQKEPRFAFESYVTVRAIVMHFEPVPEQFPNSTLATLQTQTPPNNGFNLHQIQDFASGSFG